MQLQTRISGPWRPCSDSYLRGYCLTPQKYREVSEQLKAGEVEVKGRWFRKGEVDA